MRPLLVAVVALACGLLALAATASGRTPFRDLGKGQAIADGERYALLALDGRSARVYDDVARRSWSLPSPGPPCPIAGVAGGRILYSCPGVIGSSPTSAPVLQDIVSGTTATAPGWDSYESWFERERYGWTGSGPFPAGFGSEWVRGVIQCYHCGPEFSYVNWRTGAFVESVPDAPDRVVDLDDARLDVELCKPLRRIGRAVPDYEFPWLLRNAEPQARYVRLHRCGRAKPVMLARCPKRFCAAQLGGGYLTWNFGYVLKALRLRDGRLFRFRLPVGGETVRTGRRLFINTYASGRVFALRLPT